MTSSSLSFAERVLEDAKHALYRQEEKYKRAVNWVEVCRRRAADALPEEQVNADLDLYWARVRKDQERVILGEYRAAKDRAERRVAELR